MTDIRAAMRILVCGASWQTGLMTLKEALASALKDIDALREDERKSNRPASTITTIAAEIVRNCTMPADTECRAKIGTGCRCMNAFQCDPSFTGGKA